MDHHSSLPGTKSFSFLLFNCFLFFFIYFYLVTKQLYMLVAVVVVDVEGQVVDVFVFF